MPWSRSCWRSNAPPRTNHIQQNRQSLGCLRTRKHCPPTDDFVRSLRQSSLPASKDACTAFPCAGPKSPGGGCTAVLAQRSVPRVPWKGRAEYWMYFQALYGVLWGRSPSQNQCFLIRRQLLALPVFCVIRSGAFCAGRPGPPCRYSSGWRPAPAPALCRWGQTGALPPPAGWGSP